MVEFMNPVRWRVAYRTAVGGAVVAGVVLAGGCSGTAEDVGSDGQPSYRSSRSAPPLEIPPDLSSSAVRDTLPIPGVGATYSQYASGAPRPGSDTAQAVLPEAADARIERSGDERWLAVAMKPEEVWPRLRDFWTDQGFVLETQEPDIGLMETEWAERRTPLPGHAAKRLFQQLYEAFYGVAFRDRYRTRIERGAEPGTTDIYVSHRGAEQIVLGEGTQARNDGPLEWAWQPRPSDPGLEALMLSRMLVFLGVDEERAESMVAESAPPASRARVVREDGGATALVLDEGFSPAWRRAGLALDRAGFTVEDRDRSRGLFFVRYAGGEDDAKSGDGGWLSRLQFWKRDDKERDGDTYLLRVLGDTSDTTRIVVLDEDGSTDKGPTASRILTVLHEQLR